MLRKGSVKSGPEKSEADTFQSVRGGGLLAKDGVSNWQIRLETSFMTC